MPSRQIGALVLTLLNLKLIARVEASLKVMLKYVIVFNEHVLHQPFVSKSCTASFHAELDQN
jgi:hypothetical protein